MEIEFVKHVLKKSAFQLQQQPSAITPQERELGFPARERSLQCSFL